MTSDTNYRIWKSRVIALEMVTDRGYDTSQVEKYDDFTHFSEYYGDMNEDDIRTHMQLVVYRKSKPLMLEWRKTCPVSVVSEIESTMREGEIKDCILIFNTTITYRAASVIKSLRVNGVIIETFSEAELQFNVTKNEYVPKHIICSQETKNKVMKDYNITNKDLPTISINDPPIKYLGAKRGNLIKIVRKSDTTPNVKIDDQTKVLHSITYELVV
jgi:DNA-directed RNA polymerases I, II, and III subunit RPABC1